MTEKLVAHGMIPPVPTLRNGAGLAVLSQRKLLQRLMDVGVDGVLIAGTVGEGPTLESSVREELTALAVEVMRGRAVIVGCSGGTVSRALSESTQAADLGADFALVLPPYFFRHSPAELTQFFLDVAEASPLPILAYNIPSMTGNPIKASIADQIAKHPNIVGIKDSGGDLVSFFSIHERLASDGFRVFQGAAPLVPTSLAAGCLDTMNTVSGLFPHLEYRLREALSRGEPTTASEISQSICSVVGMFRSVPCALPVNVRAIAHLIGLSEGSPSGSFREPDDHHVAELAHRLAAVGLNSTGNAP